MYNHICSSNTYVDSKSCTVNRNCIKSQRQRHFSPRLTTTYLPPKPQTFSFRTNGPLPVQPITTTAPSDRRELITRQISAAICARPATALSGCIASQIDPRLYYRHIWRAAAAAVRSAIVRSRPSLRNSISLYLSLTFAARPCLSVRAYYIDRPGFRWVARAPRVSLCPCSVRCGIDWFAGIYIEGLRQGDSMFYFLGFDEKIYGVYVVDLSYVIHAG